MYFNIRCSHIHIQILSQDKIHKIQFSKEHQVSLKSVNCNEYYGNSFTDRQNTVGAIFSWIGADWVKMCRRGLAF